MRWLPLVLPALLGGCPSPTEDTAGEEPYTPAPYIYEEESPPSADLAAADLESAIDAAVASVLALNAAPVFPAYHAAMAGAQSDCPAYYDYQGSQYWYDQCSTDAGTSFSGYGFYQLYDDYDAGDGVVYDGESLSGVAQITTPEGYNFAAGGAAYNLVAYSPVDAEWRYTYFASVIQGAFAWDGPEADGTWLADGLAPDLSVAAYNTDYGNFASVDGGLSGLGGDVDTVVFDGVVLIDASLGSSCPSEPSGTVSVRDAYGNWYDVVFDGPPDLETTADPDLCDGCGAAFFHGEPVGAVCADFTPLLDWETAPW
jgi:hypothetical protein